MHAILDGTDWSSSADRDLQVSGDLRVDSRRVRPGDVFVALQGTSSHGNGFISDAVRNGADIVLTDQDPGDCGLPVVLVNDLGSQIAKIAQSAYPVDWDRVRIVAVTGTNGKTSVTHLVSWASQRLGLGGATIGTVGYDGPGFSEQARETTPHLLEVMRLVHRWQNSADRIVVAIEASSHALDQGRLDGLPVDVAVFTNLSHDHFDYHHDEAGYRAAKYRIFDLPPGQAAVAVVPYDLKPTPAGLAGRRVLSFGRGVGDSCITDVQTAADHTVVHINFADSHVKISVDAVGGFQADNVAAAAAALVGLGYPIEQVAEALQGAPAAPGRMEPVSGTTGTVYVDYAHTPGALRASLETARDLTTSGRLICVFGCGGDRDAGKRPEMGRVACELSDQVIVTSDNPRSENPDEIIRQVIAGAAGGDRISGIADRKQAIFAALDLATVNDTVVIAGKGHERTQVFANRTIPFDDREVIRQWSLQ